MRKLFILKFILIFNYLVFVDFQQKANSIFNFPLANINLIEIPEDEIKKKNKNKPTLKWELIEIPEDEIKEKNKKKPTLKWELIEIPEVKIKESKSNKIINDSNNKFYIFINRESNNFSNLSVNGTYLGFDYSGDINLSEINKTNNIGFGYDFGSIRTDISYSNTSFDIDSLFANIESESFSPGQIKMSTSSNKLNNQSIYLNSYIDSRSFFKESIHSFIGLGIGSEIIQLKEFKIGSKTSPVNEYYLLGYKIIAGIDYSVTKRMDLFGELKYNGYNNIGDGVNDANLEGEAYMSYSFGSRIRF